MGESGRIIELRPPAPPADTGDTADTGSGDTAPGDTAPGDTAPEDTAAAVPSDWLQIGDTTWTLRSGADWASGTAVGDWTIRLDAGLFVGDTRLLPDHIAEGEAADGATITAVGPWDTAYGTFPETAAVTVDAGDWAGTQVFAKGVGPIQLTLQGQAWELVWYE